MMVLLPDSARHLEPVGPSGKTLVAPAAAVVSFFFPPPETTVDEDTAARFGLQRDAEGRVVGRDVPMRLSTLLAYFCKSTAVWFIFFLLIYLCGLAARYAVSPERFVRNAMNFRITT